MKTLTLTLLAIALGGCTTFGLVGHVEYARVDDDGVARREHVGGLFALPTPGGDIFVLLPVYRSSRISDSGMANGLPPAAQQWLSELNTPAGDQP